MEYTPASWILRNKIAFMTGQYKYDARTALLRFDGDTGPCGLCCLALFIGPVALLRKRRDWIHKISGYTWVAGITGLSVSGMFIPSEVAVIWQFGPIHLFSLFALWGVGAGVYWVWKGDIARHRAAMRSVWFGTMGLAVLLQLLPGRIMNRMIFGEPSDLSYLCIVTGGFWLFFGGRRQRQDQHPLN